MTNDDDVRRWMRLVEETTIVAVHRTSPEAADAIRHSGFDLNRYGGGAGAGPGEPAGVFVSIGNGADFARENDSRKLGMTAVLQLRLHLTHILDWRQEERSSFFKAARLEFITSKFNLSLEDAAAVVRYSIKVMKERPELEEIANWLDTRVGERQLALFLNERLRTMGYDAVSYKEPFHGIQQMIVLDPSKIDII